VGQKDRKYNYPIGNNKLNTIISDNNKKKLTKHTSPNKNIKSTCSLIR